MAFDVSVGMGSFRGCPALSVSGLEAAKGPPILWSGTIILEKASVVKGTFSVAKGKAK